MRLLGAALAVIGLLATGCTVAPTPGPSATSQTPSPSPSGPEPLAAGDCTTAIDLSGVSLDPVATVDCAEPHYWEVTAAVPVDQESYPGDTAMAALARTSCATSFSEYVGISSDYSRYVAAYLTPEAAAWPEPAHRVISCLAGSPNGGLVGSAKGDLSLFPQVGVCTGPQGVPISELAILDCAEPHHFETYAEQKINSKKAPTDKAIQKLYTKVCLAGFKKFVGIAADKSKFEATYFVANAELWGEVEDHRIVCSAGSPDGKIKGSLKGRQK